MLKIAFLSLCTLLHFSILCISSVDSSTKAKRQLYREQLLPSKGGKIPDSAFHADRLALNRLNKEGITIPDGVLLEQRHRESHYKGHRHDPDISRSIIRLAQTPDGRYTPLEGRYPSFDNEIESTYVIRQPMKGPHNILPPFKPVYGPALRVPTRNIFGKGFRDESPRNVDSKPQLQYNSVYPPVQDWKTWATVLSGLDTVKDFGLTTVLGKIGYIPDYPSYTEIPLTNFPCDKSGRMYPDPAAKCQVFHLCHFDGHKESFLCPPGTRFDPVTHECSPWHKTQCVNVPLF